MRLYRNRVVHDSVNAIKKKSSSRYHNGFGRIKGGSHGKVPPFWNEMRSLLRMLWRPHSTVIEISFNCRISGSAWLFCIGQHICSISIILNSLSILSCIAFITIKVVKVVCRFCKSLISEIDILNKDYYYLQHIRKENWLLFMHLLRVILSNSS